MKDLSFYVPKLISISSVWNFGKYLKKDNEYKEYFALEIEKNKEKTIMYFIKKKCLFSIYLINLM